MDIDRERPFYEGKVPVKVERDAVDGSKVMELTIRILPGSKKSGHQTIGLMHMEITHDVDLCFLYTMQVSDEEFHDLKTEQSLLVDFESFPPKFVELLEACKAKQEGTQQNRFIAVLDLCGLPMLKIVEANQFKQLTHLALRFQPGTDATIKTYLASRLKQCQLESSTRQRNLENTLSLLEQERQQKESIQADLQSVKEELGKSRDQLANQYAEAMSKQKEESIKLLAQTQNAASEQARKQQEQAERRIQELEAQLQHLQNEHKVLYEKKAATDAENGQLKIKVASMEKFTQDGMGELNRLRESQRELQAVKFELEKKVSEQQLTIAALKQQVHDKEEVLTKTTAMLDQSVERRTNAEEKLAHYKSTAAKLQRKLEISIKEINKGNDAIHDLQRELKQAKDKMKTKNIVLRQQENVVEDLQNQLQQKLDANTKLKESLENEKINSKQLKLALEASKQKLEECNNMLESNQNVIAFLNKEINQAQLGSFPTIKNTTTNPSTPFWDDNSENLAHNFKNMSPPSTQKQFFDFENSSSILQT